MDIKHLIAVEKWTCGLAAAMVLVAMLLLGRRAAFGVSLGAGLMALNAYALRRIGQRVIRTFKRPGRAILLLNVKMAVLLALVYVVVRYLPVDPIAFIVGISVFPVAIVIAALSHASRGDDGGPGERGSDHKPNGEAHG
jgi:hypothetical protein